MKLGSISVGGLGHALLLLAVLPASAWEPGASDPTAIGTPAVPLVVDSSDRNDVLSFYHCVYAGSEGYAERMNWTGSITSCTPGTTSQAFRDDVQRRINFYRAMAGLSADVFFTPSFNTDSQAAALLMSSRGGLSHNPSGTWGTSGCWSSAAQNGAAMGNLSLGTYGPDAISSYIRDDGANNAQVGHRRWILFQNITQMGTGDVPASAGKLAANCLYVIDNGSNRPAKSEFVPWPPAGFVPVDQIFDRWSLQFSSPTFDYPRYVTASVAMKIASTGQTIPVELDYLYGGGSAAGDGAIVWIPNWSAFGGSPPAEEAIEVVVSGITSGSSGAPTSHSYTVTPIDTDVVTDEMIISGPATPPASGASFSFTPLTGVGADSYQISVAGIDTTPWAEGAENSPEPRVIDGTSNSYQLQNALTPAFGSPGAQSGSRVFHMTFPNFEETTQSFEVDRAVLVGTESRLQFYDLFRWATTDSRLSAEVSFDGGPWEEVWARSGNGANSTAGWVKSWTFRDIDLSAHAGQSLRVRFRYVGSNFLFTGTDASDGVYIDAITVTDSSQLGDETVTPLPGTSTGFTLNETTVGGALNEGDTYYLRIQPVLGCKTFGFGPTKAVTIGPPATSGFDFWMATHHGELSSANFGDDPDGDKIPNGAEYAFGLDPGQFDTLPALTLRGDVAELRFDPQSLPYSTEDVIYGVEYSTGFDTWEPLSDNDTTGPLLFMLPPGERGFARWTVSINP